MANFRSLFYPLLFAVIAFTCHCQERKVYVVCMGNLPKEGVSVASHHTMLEDVLGSSSKANESLVYSYGKSFNGFAAKLSEEEAAKLSEMEGVISVLPNTKLQLHTIRSWDFTGLPQNYLNLPHEGDVIAGVLDTGVWPESESFSDVGFGAPSTKWKGICQTKDNFTCNKPVEKNFELSIVESDLNCKKGKKVEVERPGTGSVELQFGKRKQPDRDFWLEPVVNPKIELSDVINDLIKATKSGLAKGNPPVVSSEGTGGAYFMHDFSGQKYVAVFKPIDEEPMALNNPRGLLVTEDGEGLKKGTRVGEGAWREVAAYILDYPRSGRRSFLSGDIGFSGVPPTTMIRCLHEGFNHPQGYKHVDENIKIGSLQMFVRNRGSCEEKCPRPFPVEEVHKISVLDIRLANADRHAGNILFCKEENEGRIVLVPIDHGYCLPENFEDCTFDWLDWPQAHQPYSPETIEYIISLDAKQDIALLNFYGWELSHDCSRTLRISTMLLKKGAERGLSPFAIGSIMCRETLKKKSVIEEIVCEAEGALLPGMSEAAFLETVSQIMDRHLDELTV